MALRTLCSSKRSHARLGVLSTKDGAVETPAFVAVATNAALKAVDLSAVPSLPMLFCNTYHLMLHPGVETIQHAGGLSKFMNTDKILMTDSGGFQVFSLKYGTVHEEVHHASLKMRSAKKNTSTSLVKVTEEGVTFKSYRDGTRIDLTPERSVTAQKALGAAILMPLDELPPYHCSTSALRESTARTHRWMQRSLDTHLSDMRGQLMYGIVHGGSDKELRRQSVAFCTDQERPFDGFAIGGALGKDSTELEEIVRFVMDGDGHNGHNGHNGDHAAFGLRAVARATHRPVHVLGIADPWNIRKLVTHGCDTFDACFATKISRHGTLLCGDPSSPSRFSINSGRWKQATDAPLSETTGCDCSTCCRFTPAYVHHLVKAREPLADTLISIHNLSYMTKVMDRIREDIKNGVL